MHVVEAKKDLQAGERRYEDNSKEDLQAGERRYEDNSKLFDYT